MESIPWDKVQKYSDQGHTVRECSVKFGFATASWSKAVKSGRVRSRPNGKPLEKLLTTHSKVNRFWLKKRLIRTGPLVNKCQMCGMGPKWRGELLVLVLDHINGTRDDYRIENLRLLCPNCNSQTETFSGRNCRGTKKRKHCPVV